MPHNRKPPPSSHISKEGSKETKAKRSHVESIAAAAAVAMALESSYGPKGLDKMIVDVARDITITHDGKTILDEVELTHPIAKVLLDAAKSTDREVGDGILSMIILTGELLKNALMLISKGFHPAAINDGYETAFLKSLKISEDIAIAVFPNNKQVLKDIAATAISGKLISEYIPDAPNIIVDAALSLVSLTSNYADISIRDDVQIEWRTGESIRKTELIKGILIDNPASHPEMPKRIEKAKIALIQSELRVKRTILNPDIQGKYSISNHTEMAALYETEDRYLKSIAKKIFDAGANVVICKKEFDDRLKYYLAKYGILGVEKIRKKKFEAIAKATHAKIIKEPAEINPNDLGYAERVTEEYVAKEKWIFIRGCKDPRAVAILALAPHRKAAKESKESFFNALSSVKNVLLKPRIVYGGGAFEIEVAQRLRNWSKSISGKEQLAILAAADSFETLPMVLARNAGMDSLDTVANLKAEHSSGHLAFGINSDKRRIEDMSKVGIVDPLLVKEQIIKSAFETARIVLRVDGIIKLPEWKPTPPPRPWEQQGLR
ncbi:thermosome subunit alpha [[Eubacterium] cellulosolvens]